MSDYPKISTICPQNEKKQQKKHCREKRPDSVVPVFRKGSGQQYCSMSSATRAIVCGSCLYAASKSGANSFNGVAKK